MGMEIEMENGNGKLRWNTDMESFHTYFTKTKSIESV
jgi:hypothetical protein